MASSSRVVVDSSVLINFLTDGAADNHDCGSKVVADFLPVLDATLRERSWLYQHLPRDGGGRPT